MSVEVVQRHLRIRGRVQGVWYRASTAREAGRLGLVGRVRNQADGSVEAVAQGPSEAVEQLVAWCHEGPCTIARYSHCRGGISSTLFSSSHSATSPPPVPSSSAWIRSASEPVSLALTTNERISLTSPAGVKRVV